MQPQSWIILKPKRKRKNHEIGRLEYVFQMVFATLITLFFIGLMVFYFVLGAMAEFRYHG